MRKILNTVAAGLLLIQKQAITRSIHKLRDKAIAKAPKKQAVKPIKVRKLSSSLA